jgi:hypothetical protein
LSRFDKGDHVVTPSGDTAIVRLADKGELELEYDRPLNRKHGGLRLKEKLCRKYTPGTRIPKPVRIP